MFGGAAPNSIAQIRPESPQADVDVRPNPSEVADVRWVDQAELKEMMDPSSGLKWSPWFRIIAENFLAGWWQHLDRTLTTDEAVDVGTIHKIM